MKKLFAILVLAMAFIANVNNLKAQITVSGIVVDSLSGQGVPFATVTVATSATSTDYLMTGMTDVDGAFKGTIKKAGTYYAVIRSVGKNQVNHKFTVSSSQNSINLGKILMADKVDKLAEVTVTAQKALVSAEAGKIKYNTESDPDNKTASVLDMLRKIPMVTVDGEDNISINGNSSFVVYMNGRKNTMLSERPSEMFKAMPASSVKNIEVITDPGSKFDAEGASGIINIITDTKTKINQTSGSVTVNYSNRQKGAGASVSVQKGKFATSIRVNGSQNKSDSEMNSEQIQQLGENGTSTTENFMSSDSKSYFGNVGIEASYEIDSLNLIAISAGGMFFGNDGNSLQKITMNNSYFSNPVINNMTSESDGKFLSYDAGIDYQHMFKGDANKTLTFSYKMFKDGGDDNSFSHNPSIAGSEFMNLGGRKSSNTSNSAEHTFQIDYTTPLGKDFTLDAGGKYIFRPKDSKGETFMVGEDNSLSHVDSLDVDYTYKDNIGAVYTQLAYKITPKLSVRAGLRYEYTFQDVVYKNNHDKDFNVKYDNYVPSATLNYSISMMQNLSFTYNMRISRPSEFQLNPFKDYSEITSVSYGNVDLECQKFHNFGISYGYFSMKQNLNLSLRYNTCNNGITRYQFINDIDHLQHNTFINATENSTFSSNIYYSISINRNIRFFTNTSINYTDMKNAIANASNSGWSTNVYANFQYTFPFKLKLSAGGMLSTKRYNINGYSKGMNIGMFSLEQSFLKDKLTLSVSAMLDLKNGVKMKMESHSEGPNYSTNQNMKMSMGRIGVSLTYKFGRQIQVKRAKNTIQNDDFEQTERGGDDTPSMGGGAMGGGRM